MLPFVLSRCECSALSSLCARHLSAAPNHTTLDLTPVLGCVYFRHLRASFLSSPLLEEDWRHGKPAWKLTRIDQSFEKDCIDLNRISAFLKYEISVGLPKKARGIQGLINEASAYYKFNLYQHIKYAVMAVNGQTFHWSGVAVTVVCSSGCNLDNLADYVNSFISGVRSSSLLIDECDGKNWDATMNEVLLRLEASVYELLLKGMANDHLQRSSGSKGRLAFADLTGMLQYVRYFISWKRLSGDWNTSIGNFLINLIIRLSSLPLIKARAALFLIQGDDFLGFYDDGGVNSVHDCRLMLNEHDSACGITPDRGVSRDLLAAQFCSLYLWPSDVGFVFRPKLSSIYCKLFWTVKDIPRNQVGLIRSALIANYIPLFSGFQSITNFLTQHLTTPIGVSIDLPIAYDLLTTSRDVRVEWAYGLLRYGLPLSAFPLDLPPFHITHFPAFDVVSAWEAADPALRHANEI